MSKCHTCSKKIKLVETITSKCKCGKISCVNHKENHNCDYDYKLDYQTQVSHTMIPIIGSKLTKI